ncbi:PilX N-terminal domain-containing pilus assembly protein [uncultured Pseudomonas sp.]|uniref:pilus assembly PilX family protein n=1 Tax=uncultured Pseudomonas sp. TaxID=114707 RepID=UPI0025F5C33F|nr:PilX N-terminal domain-containing pilus assembly protein [uncultured Pseudomonas sp.]
MTPLRNAPSRQRGMVLLVSLVFLLLLTMLGISSMQNASLQEKMAGSVSLRNQTFQTAEAVLRVGESQINATFQMAQCANATACLPPTDSTIVTRAGSGSGGAVTWVAVGDGGFYAIQNLGTTASPVQRPPNCSGSATLYRVTAVAIQGPSRTVLESIYANC